MNAISRIVLAGTMGVSLAAVAGCGNDSNSGGISRSAQINAKIAREEEMRGVPAPEMHVVEKDGKTYVAGSQASADAVKAGKKFKMEKKAFGFGPNGSTVIFEDSKEGMGELLVAQWEAKQGMKK